MGIMITTQQVKDHKRWDTLLSKTGLENTDVSYLQLKAQLGFCSRQISLKSHKLFDYLCEYLTPFSDLFCWSEMMRRDEKAVATEPWEDR